MLEDMLALANSVNLLELSSGVYERESTAKHGTAWHSAAHHGTARQGTTLHGTALCRAVELASEAERVCFFRATHPGVTGKKRKNYLSPHLLKAIRCAHVLS